MPPFDEQFSGSDSDDGFSEDMEALRRVFELTGENPNDRPESLSLSTASRPGGDAIGDCESDSESDEDDIELVRNIQKRFAISKDIEEPLTLKPLRSLLPVGGDNDDDDDDDFETLRAIQRRFRAYEDGALPESMDGFLHISEQVGATVIDSEKETSNNLIVERTNAQESFSNSVDTKEAAVLPSEAHDAEGLVVTQHSNLLEWKGQRADDVAAFSERNSDFPSSALTFIDAIKKNRSYQKLMRSKLMEIETRIEEIKKMKDRVKILKDYQVACRKRSGRAFSQKKDPRVQLISVPKLRANAKFNDKKTPSIYKGPPENPHVAIYREALSNFPLSVNREKWSKKERENLVKGMKQQCQNILLQRSIDQLIDRDGSSGGSNDVDSIVASIKDHGITPEIMRSFLPEINWEQLAFMYVPGRTGAECQARWLNCEEPLINGNPWTAMEDKNLLHIIQQKGLSNWKDIACSLGTNRTPFQCLARYQRSLNASILKREWTEEEDNQLRSAVETFGESNWQHVASMMEGRTGTQCSNRWLKTLHPTRKRVGRWTADEDKRLKVAVVFFGPKTWNKVSQFVPGRTQAQCRERWVNSLDPSLNLGAWTEEEDSNLEEAILKHGYQWSKVAACVTPRTDNQCRRRWKVLFPHEVPQLQAAKRIQKSALISNFVDRESERPALGPKDFVPPPNCIAESKRVDPHRKRKRSRREKNFNEEDTPSSETCPEEVPRLTDGKNIENMHGRSIPRKKRGKRMHSAKGKGLMVQPSGGCEGSNPTEKRPSPFTDPNVLMITTGEELVGVDGDDAAKTTEAYKLGPMRRCHEPPEEVPETSSAVDALVGDASLFKRKRISGSNEGSDAPNVDVGEDHAIEINKNSELHPRRRCNEPIEEVPETSSSNEGTAAPYGDGHRESSACEGGIALNKHCRSSFGTEVAGDGEYTFLSPGRENELELVDNSDFQPEERLPGGKFLIPVTIETGENDTAMGSTKSNNSPGKQHKILQRKRRRGDTTCSSQNLEVENGPRGGDGSHSGRTVAKDDMTLAAFYNLQKKRIKAKKK